MARSVVKPDDILPQRGINLIVGIGVLLVAVFILLPVYSALRYDGIGSVFGWPFSLHVFMALGLAMLATATNLLFRPQRVGAEVAFHDDGFTIQVRRYLLRDRRHRLAWTDIETMTQVEAPRSSDLLVFRLTHDAAIREKLIQPTTRPDAPRSLARREVKLPLLLAALSTPDAVQRFQASAEGAGARLVEQSGFNVVIFVRKIWSVEWP